MSRYIKRFGDPKEKTRPRVSHYTGRRMQPEEFLCTPDKIFLFVIFPAMHVGIEKIETPRHEWNRCCYACSKHTLKSNVGFLFGAKGEMVSLCCNMYAFCKYQLGPNQIGYWQNQIGRHTLKGFWEDGGLADAHIQNTEWERKSNHQLSLSLSALLILFF